MSRPQRFRLGDLLVQDALISTEQLEQALSEQRSSGRKLGQVLIDHGWITEAQIAKAVARQLRAPYIDLGELGRYTLPRAASAINETESIVRVRDGQIVAIGGLMQQKSVNDRSGVPGLSGLPGVGGLFRYQANSEEKHELVILIKPTVISEDGQGWPSADSALARFNEMQPN